MREIDDQIALVMKKLPDGYDDVVMRLKTSGDWKSVELVLALIRERILEVGKTTGDGRAFLVLSGFDAVFKILDKMAGTYKSRAAVEKTIFGLKEIEEGVQ